MVLRNVLRAEHSGMKLGLRFSGELLSAFMAGTGGMGDRAEEQSGATGGAAATGLGELEIGALVLITSAASVVTRSVAACSGMGLPVTEAEGGWNGAENVWNVKDSGPKKVCEVLDIDDDDCFPR